MTLDGVESVARVETENRGEATINLLGTQQFVSAGNSRSATVDDSVSGRGPLTARTGRDALARDSLRLHPHQWGYAVNYRSTVSAVGNRDATINASSSGYNKQPFG